MLDQSNVKEWFHYDPETGVFSRLRRALSGRGSPKTVLLESPEPCERMDDMGYILLGIRGNIYRAHRVAFLYMTGKWPARDVDHINRNRADNRWCNLREVTRTQNSANSVHPPGKSGLKGVRFDKRRGKWWALIQPISRYLGAFDTPEEAKAAYDKAAREHWGEYYRP